jgi:hypothetical protein
MGWCPVKPGDLIKDHHGELMVVLSTPENKPKKTDRLDPHYYAPVDDNWIVGRVVSNGMIFQVNLSNITEIWKGPKWKSS